MKAIYRIILSVILLCAVVPDAHAQLFGSRLKRQNRELSLEKERLSMVLDSLRSVNAAYQQTIDSLTMLSNASASEPQTDDFEISDSLLREWHILQHAYNVQYYDVEAERFAADVPDSVYIERLRNIHSFIPLPFNSVVRNSCVLFSEKYRTQMGVVLGLSEYYWPIFDEILSHYDIPLEMKALVVVESMLRPTATSRVGAKGLWQFMYRTAKGYGLRIDSWVDERMDPVKSTEAAARYLRDAYRVFGDWTLAIASYNCGPGGINKAIRRSGGQRDFWSIYEYLPRETRGYVPAFVGVLYATHYYKEHGIIPVKAGITVPVDTFHIHRNLHYAQLDTIVGVPQTLVAELNPQYLHDIIPGENYPCVLRLPLDYVHNFIEAGDSLYNFRKDELLGEAAVKKVTDGIVNEGNRLVYKVKSGDVLGRIANRYGVSVAQLKKWNNLSSNNIRVGQKLYIYPRK